MSHPVRRRAACIFMAAWLAGCALHAGAQEIRIGAPDCRSGITVRAKNARAIDVLNALSRWLDFSLSLEAPVDGIVNIDSALRYSELVERVLPSSNVIASYRRDPACPAQYRLARVWVLRRAAVKPPPHLPAIAAIPVRPEALEQDEIYQRAHGMLPPIDEPAK